MLWAHTGAAEKSLHTAYAHVGGMMAGCCRPSHTFLRPHEPVQSCSSLMINVPAVAAVGAGCSVSV